MGKPFLSNAKSAMRKGGRDFLVDEEKKKKVRWKSDPAVSIHHPSRRVCIETSMDQSGLAGWQGPQSRVTLDRFHRALGGLVCRGFEAAATDSFWIEGKVQG